MAPPADPEIVERPNFFLRTYFGKDARIEKTSLGTLRLVALGLVFENYDIGLVNSALPQIREGLAITHAETGYLTGLIRLGGLVALLLIPFADRIGRRRIFLLSIIGMSLGTFATAFAQTADQFMMLQMVTRGFMLTGATLAVVIVVEEFPAHQRGGAIGLITMIGGLGYGLGAGVYAAVDWLPHGWRDLYAIGALPLLLIPFFRRTLKETRRFERDMSRRERVTNVHLFTWLDPLRELWRENPRRATSICAVGILASMGSISVFQYTSAFVQESHGWAPGHYSLLVLGAGLIGVGGTLVGGRGSDLFGRRRVGFFGFVVAPIFAILFFTGPGATLAIAWGLYVLCMSTGEVVVRAFAAELFPTSQRSTSGGTLIAVQAVGFAAGLFLTGFLIDRLGSVGNAVAWVAVASALAAVWLLPLPETSDRELEALHGDSTPKSGPPSGPS